MEKHLDILLVQPSGNSYDIGNTGSDGYAMAIIAEVANQAGLATDYYIQRPENNHTNVELAERLLKRKPKIVGIETMSCYANASIELVRAIKHINQQVITVMGAYHPSGYPEVLFDANGSLDFLCLGASEKTFTKLSTEILNGQEPIFPSRRREVLPSNRYSRSLPICEQQRLDRLVFESAYAYLENGQICLVERTEEDLLKNVNQIPIPRRNPEWHKDVTSGVLSLPTPDRQVAATMHTTKGCFNRCSYCQSENIFGVDCKKLFLDRGLEARTRSPENVVSELAYLSSLGINFVFLTDLNFNSSGDFIRELSDRVVCAKKVGDINPEMGFYCMCKPHNAQQQAVFGLDFEIYSVMKKMGICNVAFGVEFLDQQQRNLFGRLNATDQDLLEHLEAVNQAGIFSKGLMMYGTTDDTLERIESYPDYMASLPIDVWRLAPVVPFVGTRYGNAQIRELLAQGKLKLPQDFDLFNANTAIITPDDQRLSKEVLQLKKQQILSQVYSDPRHTKRLSHKAKQFPELIPAVEYFDQHLQKKGYRS